MAGPASSSKNAKDSNADGAKSPSNVRSRPEKTGSSGPYAEIMYLQRAIGNQAVGQWLTEMGEDEDAEDADLPYNGPVSGAENPTRPAKNSAFQPKLKVSQPGDPAEIEAETLSESIVAAPAAQPTVAPGQPGNGSVVQRKSMNLAASAGKAGPGLNSAGQPLEQTTRNFMEPRFGQDFSQVRVHTGPEASQSANAVNALAYTVGPDIVFGEGQYQPGNSGGQKLLAHELTHVVQQGHSDTTDSEGGPVAHRATPQIARAPGGTATKLRTLTRIQLIPKENKAVFYVTNAQPVVLNLNTCTARSGTYSIQVRFQVSQTDQDGVKARKVYVATSASKDVLKKMDGGFAFGGDSTIGFDPNADYDLKTTTIPLVVAEYDQGSDDSDEDADEDTSDQDATSDNDIEEDKGDSDTDDSEEDTEDEEFEADDIDSGGSGEETDEDTDKEEETDKTDEDEEESDSDEMDDEEEDTEEGDTGEEEAGEDETGDDGESQDGTEEGSDEDAVEGKDEDDPNKTNGAVEDPGMAGDKGDHTPANAPALPMALEGLDQQPVGGIGAYQAKLVFPPDQQNLLNMTLESGNYFDYSWELYDVSDQVAKSAGNAKAQREAAAKAKLDPKKAHEATIGEGSDAGIDKAKEDVESDTKLANERGEKASQEGDVSGILVNLANVALEKPAYLLDEAGAYLDAVSDHTGQDYSDRKIPWKKEGTFVIRVKSTPSREPKSDGTYRQRATSVAVKAISVMSTQKLADEAVGEADAQIAELESKLPQTEDEEQKARLTEQIEQLKMTAHGGANDIIQIGLKKKWAEYEAAKAEGNPYKIREIRNQLDDLLEQAKLAQAREAELGGTDQIIRPQATIVSELTGQSYGLLLQMSISAPKEGSNQYTAQISDVSTKDGRGDYNSSGATASDAAWSAAAALAAGNSYGTGQLAVRMPEGTAFEFKPQQKVIPNRAQDGMMVRKRLEDLATVLAILSLVVPGLGEVGMALGAGLAADRLYQRYKNGTLRSDPELVTDILTIAGGLLAGVTAIGNMRVVTEGGTVFLRAVKVAGKVAEGTNKVLNEVQFVLGGVDTYQKIVDINQEVLKGNMTQAEARKQRAHLLAGSIQQVALYGKGKADEHQQAGNEENQPGKLKGGNEEDNNAPEEDNDENAPESKKDENTPESKKDENTPETPRANEDENTPESDEDENGPKSNKDENTPDSVEPDSEEDNGEAPPERLPTGPDRETPASPDSAGDETGPAAEEPHGTKISDLVSGLKGEAESDRRAKLEAGDPAEMQRLLDEAGNWKELLGALGGSDDPQLQNIGKNLSKYRDGIVSHLETVFGAKPISGASTELISDVDLSTYGAHAGDDLLRSEAYMENKYGSDWSEKFRMNFYTEAGRLTRYREAMSNLSPEQQVQVLKTMTALTEKFNFARMLHHAEGDPAATKRVQEAAKGVGFDLTEVESLAHMDDKTRQANRERILKEVDGLQGQYEKATGSERDQLAIEISKKQIEANFYVEEAYIGPGAGIKTVQGQRVTGHEAYQSALSDFEMIQHILKMAGGDVIKACREYELYKYVHRFTEASRTAGIESPQLAAFENIAAYLYRANRQAHSENPGRVDIDKESGGSMKHTKPNGTDPIIPRRTDEPPGEQKPISPQTLQSLYDNFMDTANKTLPEIKKKADASTATPDNPSEPGNPGAPNADPDMPVLKANPESLPPDTMSTIEDSPDTDRGLDAPLLEGPAPENAPPEEQPGSPPESANPANKDSNAAELVPGSIQTPGPETVPGRPDIPLAHGLNHEQGYASFNEFLQAHADLESALWADLDTGEYVVVQGTIGEISNEWFQERGLVGRKWKIIEHFHPGEGHMSRFASPDDFQVMRYLKTQGVEAPGSDSTRIRWYNPDTKDYEYTTIGFDADNGNKPYWIRYLDYNGNMQFERFADTPWNADSDYQTFLNQQRAQRPIKN